MRIVVIDNYDSFVYNLVQYAGELGAEPVVFRNDAVTVAGVRKLKPDALLLSPGPGNPADRRAFGVCGDLLKQLSPRLPTLGVCLGHQGIALHFGGRVAPAPEIVHGKASPVFHDGKTLFRRLPNPFQAGRYHSLVADPSLVPAELEVSARTEDGVIMGLRHRRYPVEGVQFHPESILTPHGKRLMGNFLRLAANWHETGRWGW